MRIGEVKSQARAALSGKWGLAVGTAFLIGLISSVIPGLVEVFVSGGFSNYFAQEEPTLTATIANLVTTVLLIPLGIGLYWFFLRLVREENPTLGSVFEVYADLKTSIKLIVTSIVVGFFVLLWSLLLIIPGIIKGIAYSQAFYILKDKPEYGTLQAITESRKLMDGYKWKYFLLQLSFIGWILLSILTLGIGLLWVIPYMNASYATFYQNLVTINNTTIEE
ncbi:DUF975 family protein [Bacillus suaedaesalsae]|uniref:DUF975 family protein n=1 Tax=Bacillus suaedaesalsae TaxID=2810349 RepID=A0ABS2DEF9_9BACI|nr:DUF975 family protein [Bacillus suaedaesalsae]MBM6616840.1 DUF975 family protein [Bacillus suaedaesalsae]